MGEGLARAITIGSIVLTVGSLAVAVSFARKRSRIRVGFDAARAFVGVGAILVMAAVTHIATPLVAIVLAVAVGLGFGFTQGAALEISPGKRGFYARRSPIGIVLWGSGIVIMQAAGIASRTGTVRLGQTIAWFSACLGIGLMAGRNGPLQNAKQAFAGAGVAALIAALVLPTVALVAGGTTPALAQTIDLTNEEVCALIPDSWSQSDSGWYLPGDGLEAVTEVRCMYVGGSPSGENNLRVSVSLFSSSDAARIQFAVPVSDEYTPGGVGPATSLEFGDGATHWAWFQPDELTGGTNLSWTKSVVGPFLIVVSGNGPGLDTIAVAREVTAIVAELVPATPTEPPPPMDEATPPTDDATSNDGAPPDGTTSSTQDDQAGVSPRDGEDRDQDDPVTPEEAAAQAIGGLIAAAAIGLISWAEAAAEIEQILTGTRNTSILDPKAEAKGAEPSQPEPDSVKDDPANKEDMPKKRTDPCAFQLDRYRRALAVWQRTQNEISALENEYALLKNRIENEGESDFLGAVFDLGMLGIDMRGSKPPSSGMFQAMIESAKQNYGRSIAKQLIQRTATGQPMDVEAITWKASVDATGLDALVEKGRPTSGAFGTFFNESVTRLLAANRSYDYLKFMDTLAKPGALSDPEVMRLIEKSSMESFTERIGPWVGVVTKYLDFYYKNQEWGKGVERRNKMGDELVRIKKRIDELKILDLEEMTAERDRQRRFLSGCREENP